MPTNISRLDEILAKYTTVGSTPDPLRAAAFIVKDRNGQTLYSNAVGKLTSKDDSPPFTQDSVGWSASMTKIVTSVAAMQLVERGLIGLDDDVGQHVPYLADVQVLTGFDDSGGAVLERRTQPITLRKLLTHTAGFAYDATAPQLQQWSRVTNRPASQAYTLDALKTPLVFQPGSSWTYGTSLDWAGQVVEAVSGLPLEEYMRRHIFGPLGMDSATFFSAAGARPDLAEVDDHYNPHIPAPAPPAPLTGQVAEIAYGGSGLFASANDYGKLIGAIVAQDPRILSAETLATMFSPQLDDATLLQGFCEIPLISPMPDATGPGYAHPVPVNHSLCGAVAMEDVPGHKKKGSMTWKGMTNSHWWVDPVLGIGGTLYVQVLPYGTKAVVDLSKELETEVYSLWGPK